MNISKEEIEQFREAFKLFDTNGDGDVDIHELDAMMRSLGEVYTRDGLVRMIQAVDEDGSGTINFDEFLTLMANQLPGNVNYNQVLEAFRVFDLDKNGFISRQELSQAMSNLGHPLHDAEIEIMIRRVDVNEDGMIDYEEFTRLMTLFQ